MAKQSSVNLDITNNADGFDISGGTTVRKLGITGGDVTIAGSGSATVTFPTTSTTIAGLGITQSFSALQSFSAGISAAGGVTFANAISVDLIKIGRGSGGYTYSVANVAIGNGYDRPNLEFNTTGEQNTAIGYDVLPYNTTGNYNVGVGTSALEGNDTGSNNTAVGHSTLIVQNGSENTAVGAGALSYAINNQNTAIGYLAGSIRGTGFSTRTSGTGGIFIGYQARASGNARTNEIVIGTNALGLGSNTAVIGATAQTAATIYGLMNLPGGLSAAGATFSGNISAPNIVNSVNGATGPITNVALTTNTLSQFASTSSAELATLISNETGSGSLVFAQSPAIVTSLTTSSATFALVNTTATTLNLGGAATTLTVGATSGTASIRNPTLILGNTNNSIGTNSGSTNYIAIQPYGNIYLQPASTAFGLGSIPKLVITNDRTSFGQVQISGGDLYLGTKSADGEYDSSPVQIIFEGATDNNNETTLTVVDPTADRTITFPDASGTVALTSGLVSSLSGSTYISVSGSTGAVTITNTGVQTFNGLTGAVTGVTVGGTNVFTALNTFNAGISAAGSTFSGNVNLQDNTLSRVELLDYCERFVDLGDFTSSGTQIPIDLSTGQVFRTKLTVTSTGLNVTNTPDNGNANTVGFNLLFVGDGTARTMTWNIGSTAIGWAGGIAPSYTSTSNKIDVYSFLTRDGGSNWLGFVGGQNF